MALGYNQGTLILEQDEGLNEAAGTMGIKLEYDADMDRADWKVEDSHLGGEGLAPENGYYYSRPVGDYFMIRFRGLQLGHLMRLIDLDTYGGKSIAKCYLYPDAIDSTYAAEMQEVIASGGKISEVYGDSLISATDANISGALAIDLEDSASFIQFTQVGWGSIGTSTYEPKVVGARVPTRAPQVFYAAYLHGTSTDVPKIKTRFGSLPDSMNGGSPVTEYKLRVYGPMSQADVEAWVGLTHEEQLHEATFLPSETVTIPPPTDESGSHADGEWQWLTPYQAEVTFESLMVSGNYVVQVSAVNEIGEGPSRFSNVVNFDAVTAGAISITLEDGTSVEANLHPETGEIIEDSELPVFYVAEGSNFTASVEDPNDQAEWSTGNDTVATIDTSTGVGTVLDGQIGYQAIISYTLPNGSYSEAKIVRIEASSSFDTPLPPVINGVTGDYSGGVEQGVGGTFKINFDATYHEGQTSQPAKKYKFYIDGVHIYPALDAGDPLRDENGHYVVQAADTILDASPNSYDVEVAPASIIGWAWEDGKTYKITVKETYTDSGQVAESEEFEWTYNAPVIPARLPDVPTLDPITFHLNTEATNGVGYAHVQWDVGSLADLQGYDIYYAATADTPSEDFIKVAGTGTTTRSVQIEGISPDVPLVPGNEYGFRVTAQNTDGVVSDPSNWMSFTFPVTPEAMVLTEATWLTEEGKAKLAWEPLTNSEHVNGIYLIGAPSEDTPPEDFVTVGVTSANLTEIIFNDDGLPGTIARPFFIAGQEYGWRLVAYNNSVGGGQVLRGAPSNWMSFTVPGVSDESAIPETPDVPTLDNLVFQVDPTAANGMGVIYVQWDVGSSVDLQGFDVYYASREETLPENFIKVAGVGRDSRSVQIESITQSIPLLPDYEYGFRVRSRNTDGAVSDYSERKSITLPVVPETIVLTEATWLAEEGMARIAWEPLTAPQHITNLRLIAAPSENTPAEEFVVVVSNLSKDADGFIEFRDSDLPAESHGGASGEDRISFIAGQEYGWRIVAYRDGYSGGALEGAPSNWMSFTIPEASDEPAVPEAPVITEATWEAAEDRAKFVLQMSGDTSNIEEYWFYAVPGDDTPLSDDLYKFTASINWDHTDPDRDGLISYMSGLFLEDNYTQEDTDPRQAVVGKTYGLRARAKYTDGTLSGWSNWSSFTVAYAPSIPRVIGVTSLNETGSTDYNVQVAFQGVEDNGSALTHIKIQFYAFDENYDGTNPPITGDVLKEQITAGDIANASPITVSMAGFKGTSVVPIVSVRNLPGWSDPSVGYYYGTDGTFNPGDLPAKVDVGSLSLTPQIDSVYLGTYASGDSTGSVILNWNEGGPDNDYIETTVSNRAYQIYDSEGVAIGTPVEFTPDSSQVYPDAEYINPTIATEITGLDAGSYRFKVLLANTLDYGDGSAPRWEESELSEVITVSSGDSVAQEKWVMAWSVPTGHTDLGPGSSLRFEVCHNGELPDSNDPSFSSFFHGARLSMKHNDNYFGSGYSSAKIEPEFINYSTFHNILNIEYRGVNDSGVYNVSDFGNSQHYVKTLNTFMSGWSADFTWKIKAITSSGEMEISYDDFVTNDYYKVPLVYPDANGNLKYLIIGKTDFQQFDESVSSYANYTSGRWVDLVREDYGVVIQGEPRIVAGENNSGGQYDPQVTITILNRNNIVLPEHAAHHSAPLLKDMASVVARGTVTATGAPLSSTTDHIYLKSISLRPQTLNGFLLDNAQPATTNKVFHSDGGMDLNIEYNKDCTLDYLLGWLTKELSEFETTEPFKFGILARTWDGSAGWNTGAEAYWTSEDHFQNDGVEQLSVVPYRLPDGTTDNPDYLPSAYTVNALEGFDWRGMGVTPFEDSPRLSYVDTERGGDWAGNWDRGDGLVGMGRVIFGINIASEVSRVLNFTLHSRDSVVTEADIPLATMAQTSEPQWYNGNEAYNHVDIQQRVVTKDSHPSGWVRQEKGWDVND